MFGLADQSIEFVAAHPPATEWTEDQRRCIDAVTLGRPIVYDEALTRELSRLRWPVAYIDFEFDPGMAVPRFPGCRPYDRLPFQWSMLVQERSGGPVQARTPFLHIEATDPRGPFLDSFLEALPATGSIVAHHAAAEITVLRQVAQRLGAGYPERVAAAGERMLDTEVLSRAGYYSAQQQGSYSIKKLAPALLGRGYDDLAIQGGMAAVVAWRQACREVDAEARRRIREDLLAYCGRDTHLMHEIVEALRRHAREGV